MSQCQKQDVCENREIDNEDTIKISYDENALDESQGLFLCLSTPSG